MGAVICISDFSDVRTDIYNISEQQIPFSFADIYGNSQDMHTLRRYAKQIAGTDSAILIRGESGTGKEVFARAIHNQSQRRTEPFVPINCAAIPESLLESELFGYEEGAFSGAKKGGKPGKFELANGGTLFLDEIGDMPLHMQIKLFRVLQEQCIERIGSLKSIPIDVRVISATNQDLKNLITLKKFREELYFRLNVMPLNIPPLRERPEDIPDLAYFFLKKYNHKNNKSIETIDADVFDYLCAYSWPGNVRELENLMEYIVNMTFETRVTRDRLPSNLLVEHDLHSRAGTLTERVKSYERMIIQKTMDKYQGSGDEKTKAASELGISLPTLYRKLRTK